MSSLINNPLAHPLFIPVTIRLAAILAGGFGLVVIFNLKALGRMFGSETFNGGPLGWVLMFTLGPGVVFGVSAVSLFLNHIITSTAIADSP